ATNAVAVALSPDGTLLAAGDAEGRITVWSVPGGAQCATVRAEHNGIRCLAFARDVRRDGGGDRNDGPQAGWLLAAGTAGGEVVALEDGRGIETLRGLTGQVAEVQLSPCGRWLGALSHDGRLGVWRRPGGELRHVLTVPRGVTAENAAFAFSPDGTRLAYTAG